MKKYLLTILILTTWATFSTAQNLVPNSSFEIDTLCPDNPGQVAYAVPWTGSANTSPDLFNSCSYSIVDVPGSFSIFGGYQYAHSGNAYTGLIALYASDEREYLQVKLIDSLTSGITYRVEFYVNLTNYAKYGIDAMGAYISSIPVSGTFEGLLSYTPQVSNPVGNYLTDTLNWMLINGTFVASGGEKYLTIGNFKSNALTNKIISNSTAASSDTTTSYYYVDDVSLYPDSITGINEQFNFNNYKIYPNPTNQLATLEFSNPTKQNCILTLYDLHGRVVRTINNITVDKVEIERQSLANGLYFFQLRTDRQIIATGKLTIE